VQPVQHEKVRPTAQSKHRSAPAGHLWHYQVSAKRVCRNVLLSFEFKFSQVLETRQVKFRSSTNVLWKASCSKWASSSVDDY